MTENMKATDLKDIIPNQKIPWLESTEVKNYSGNHEASGDTASLIKEYVEDKLWVWPKKTIFFFSDLHGDREAFKRSLLATGEVTEKKGKLKLTDKGKKSKFIIGGDLFDKGPSNLDLLDLIHEFLDADADLDIIAGNHDIRTFVGIHYLGDKSLKTSHLFTRVGGKSLTLFKEIYDRYQGKLPKCPHSEEELIDLMFPSDEWLAEFPEFAKDVIHPAKLEKEIKRIKEKIQEIQDKTKELGLTLADIWSCVEMARELFLEPKGKYYWVFDRLELARIYGSFLFVHGGVDDEILSNIFKRNPKQLRKWFHEELKADAFDLYHGPIGNCFRTKYRIYDHPLTEKGIKELHKRGVFAIVHGHLNQLYGQRMIYREGMLHFQCDCSLDQNTRLKQGLPKPGMAVTIFRPNGTCEAISSDYDKIKVFNTENLSNKKDINHQKVEKDELIGKVIKGKVVKKTKKAKFEHESLEDQESIIKYLETIIDGFKSGKLTFGNNKKSVDLSPQGLLKLKINVSSNEKKVKLGLNMEWKEKVDKDNCGDLIVNADKTGDSKD